MSKACDEVDSAGGGWMAWKTTQSSRKARSKVESGVSSNNNRVAGPDTGSGVLDAVCRLPHEVGPCSAMLKRWYYDASSGRCVEFVYGGCKGNANNFGSRDDCEARCGVIKVESGVHPDGGEADTTALCHLPQDRGNCYALIQRWAFDANSSQCIQFTYSGCGGNANNFETKEACEGRCLASIAMPIPATGSGVLDAVCRLPHEVGPCRAMLKRWYYDASSGRCVEFVYGGCKGNANNFGSRDDCEARCGGPHDSHCEAIPYRMWINNS
ncbi:Carboxypeptidase inhibitor SmCI [Taenia solium]|eukprot:TsM_000515300 transcript=TsM_000515300 gene=TsM_000515300